MTTSTSLVAPHLQAFFTDHLAQHKRASPQTVASCRDTFRLLLRFVQETKHIEPSSLCLTELDMPLILTFLDYLEHQRGNTVRSRNIRLSTTSTFLQLHGKGRKDRTIPLWPQTSRVLKDWFWELGEDRRQRAFPNAQRQPLSRHGVNYLLQQAVQKAMASCPSLQSKTVTPHVIRHYLPFLTMSGNLSASTDVAGFHRLQGLDRLTVTRHSFLVPTDRCSGWSPG